MIIEYKYLLFSLKEITISLEPYPSLLEHVYTEKTMTLSAQSAMNLQCLAKSKGLYLGSAPDTFLGAALQTARKAIDDGLIGEVTSFDICANRDLDYLSGVSPFLCMPGGGTGGISIRSGPESCPTAHKYLSGQSDLRSEDFLSK